jgi:hypothetical protein
MGSCDGSICGITDTFNRADGPVGTSDSGIAWVDTFGGSSITSNQLSIPSGEAVTLVDVMPFPFFSSIEIIESLAAPDVNQIGVNLNDGHGTGVLWTVSGGDVSVEVIVNGEVQAGMTGTITYPVTVELDINGTGMAVKFGDLTTSVLWADVYPLPITVTSVSDYQVGYPGGGGGT